MAKLTKPGDDVSAVITAALINLPGLLLVLPEGDAAWAPAILGEEGPWHLPQSVPLGAFVRPRQRG